ncbi:thioredoxin [Phocaeicola sartorii]|uniref:thioredoxin n=1 Tax=Phocaeicola sartorii TaxID=671267 RepID=UPI002558028C|nr:thioredoxin [Phocaeicola sartorii]
MRLKLFLSGILSLTIAAGAFAQTESQPKQSGTIYLTTQDFKDKVYDYVKYPDEFKYKGDKPAIVDFYAVWCGPCKKLSPVLDELAKEYAGRIYIYKADVDKEAELARKFSIRSIPTLLFIPEGSEPSMSVGAPSKDELKKIIDKMLDNASGQ